MKIEVSGPRFLACAATAGLLTALIRWSGSDDDAKYQAMTREELIKKATDHSDTLSTFIIAAFLVLIIILCVDTVTNLLNGVWPGRDRARPAELQ
jgi:hypothetical protein